jgi:2-polyprenyl-3-methyl-5-hydroxy-6-metoxy-1,4-benzoquinol methylase
MDSFDRNEYWNKIYRSKELKDLSWFQSTPATSLDFFHQYKVPLTAKIIDIGGGDSLLVDYLLDLGYQDVTVLDISDTALEKARQRLGQRVGQVKWIVDDAATFKPTEKYDFWHDRAAFHFLTRQDEIENYLNTVQQSINPGGILVIGTFSEQGPKQCSGIEIKQYSEASMTIQLKRYFDKIKCITVDHMTPFGTSQNFIFCSFRKT